MPKIFEYIGFVFFFYTNEHLPIHVHIRKGENESKCELIFDNGILELQWRKVRSKNHLTEQEKIKAGIFIEKHYSQIVEKWQKVFILHQKVSCEKIGKLP
jgi:hypothetical protein